MSRIIFEPSASVSALATRLESLAAEYRSIMILACDANGYTPDTVDSLLRSCSASIFGAVFPSVLYDGTRYSEGTVLVGFDEPMRVCTVEEIGSGDAERVEAAMAAQSDSKARTMFVFVDGLSKNIGASVQALFRRYGSDVNYIGGGSGSLSFMQKPSLFTNDGLIEDALVYAHSVRKSAIGVSHGWRSISGPYKVTRSEGTVVQELNHRPAFEVYKSVVDRYSPTLIDSYNFFEIAKSFPFGLNTVFDEMVVRDPIVLRGTEMICVGNVDTGSYVDILRGESDELIRAAKEAVERSRKQMDFDASFMFFVDCISRVLFLEGRFEDEVDAVYDPAVMMVGALTFGEIANIGREALEFYNKTSVVGHIGHRPS
jgi:hypothetical protein